MQRGIVELVWEMGRDGLFLLSSARWLIRFGTAGGGMKLVGRVPHKYPPGSAVHILLILVVRRPLERCFSECTCQLQLLVSCY